MMGAPTYSFQNIFKESHNVNEMTPLACNQNLDQFLNRLWKDSVLYILAILSSIRLLFRE